MRQLLYLIIFFVVTGLQAQQKKSYRFTLQEAVTFALDSNYSAINAKRDVDAAFKQKWETTATGLPQISAQVDYQNQLKQPVTPLPAELVGGQPGTFVPVIFAVPQTMSATATLNQMIFDGSYIVGLQAAKTFLRYSQNAQEKTRSLVRKDVISAYGTVILAKENISILEKNRATLEKNLRETTEIFKNGLAEEEDVEQLQITLSGVDIQLDNAIRLLDISKQLFSISVGIDLDAEVEFSDSLLQLIENQMSLEILSEDLVLENNIDFKIAENFTQQRELELKLEKSRALPSLNAFVNYGTTAFGNNFSFLDADTPWFQSSILGVSLQVPIFSSLGRSAKTKRAEIAFDQAKTEFREAIQKIKLEANSAKNNYKFAVEKYENTKNNLRLAERIENKNQIKFFEGLSSSFELRQAQMQLYSAQQEYLQSMLDVINNKAELERILNTTN